MILKPRLFRKPRNGHWSTKGLVGLWLLYEGSGDKVFDLSGNGNIGTFVSGPVWQPAKFGSGIYFDGSAYINFLFGAESSTEGSAVFWFKDNSTGAAGGLWCITDDLSLNYLIIQSDGTNWDLVAAEQGTPRNIGNILVQDTIWHQMVITWSVSQGEIKVYVDGKFVNQAIWATGFAGAVTIHVIGAGRDNVAYGSNAYFDNYTLMNRPLAASEIALLYREPFIMFERDPIELWVGSVGAGAPAGVNAAGQADIVTSSLAGFRRLNRPGVAQADIVTSSLSGMTKTWNAAAQASIVTSSLAGMRRLNRPGAAQADIVTSSLAGMRRLNRPGAAQAAINIQTFAGATGGAAVTTLEEIFRYRRYRDAGVFRRRNLKGVY